MRFEVGKTYRVRANGVIAKVVGKTPGGKLVVECQEQEDLWIDDEKDESVWEKVTTKHKITNYVWWFRRKDNTRRAFWAVVTKLDSEETARTRAADTYGGLLHNKEKFPLHDKQVVTTEYEVDE